MALRVSRVWICCVVVVVLSGVGIAIASPAGAAPLVNVAPRTGLVDLQHVTVAGKGFSPNAQVGTVECRPGALGESDCDLGTLVYHRVDANGAFSFQRYVRRIITVGGKSIDCAKPAGCILGAGNVANLKQAGGKTIHFDPNVPPKVTKIVASPNTGLVDHQLITVSGSGFAPGSSVYLSECLASLTGPCDYGTQRYVRVGRRGTFTAKNFVLERRQVTYNRTGTKRVDCADAPKKCVVVARPSGFGSAKPPTAPLVFDPHKPLAVETAHLSPSSQLTDLESVTVTGGGFTPGYTVNIIECEASAKSAPGLCDYSTAHPVTAGFHGEFTTSYFVRREIAVYDATGPAAFDCGGSSGACLLVFQGSPAQPNKQVPLDFDPSVPAVPPSITASPDTGLADNQRVSITIGGFTPDHPVQITECTKEAVTRSDFSYCDYATSIVTTPGGPSGTASFVVRSVVRAADGLEDCKSAPGACVLVAVGFSQFYGGYAASAVPRKAPLSSLPNTASTDLTFSP